MTELYLIRHAESEGNTRTHLIGGRNNETPLTPKGIKQAKALGSYLLTKNIIPTEIYTSPAVRTVQTATHALMEMGCVLSPATVDALQELDQGEWTGRPREEVYTAAIHEEIKRLGKDFKAPGGESMNEVGKRMLQWVESSFNEESVSEEPRRVLVFTHGIAIKCLASVVHGWDHERTYKTAIGNISISLFTGYENNWQLEYIGQ